MTSLSVAMTVHNRCHQTRLAVEALQAAMNGCPGVRLNDVVVVDDGSSDGTWDYISGHPSITEIRGPGDLFWNGGMRIAFAQATTSSPDYVLWLNDDTELFPNAVKMMIATEQDMRQQVGACIVAGSTVGRDGEMTYGGQVRTGRLNPLRFEVVEPAGTPRRIDSMHGNCVLIPREVFQTLGNLSGYFTHAFGDTDYGLRACKADIGVYLAPGYVGRCEWNTASRAWLEPGLGARERLRAILSPKGIPPRELMRFARRHGGPLWPLWFSIPYLKALQASIASLLTKS